MHAHTALLKCLNRTEVSLWQSRGHIKDKYRKHELKGTIQMKTRYLLGCCAYLLGCNNRPSGHSSKPLGFNSLLTVYPGASVVNVTSNLSYEHNGKNSGDTCEAWPAALFGEEPAATGGTWNKSSNDSCQPQIWSSEHR